MNKLLLVGALLLIGVGTLWLLTQSDRPIAAPPETASSAAGGALPVDAQSALGPELPSQVAGVEARIAASPTNDASTAPAQAALPTADFRGRVLRKSDKSPLAEFALELRDETDRKLLVITDADGRFAAPSPLALGVVQARILDHPERTVSVWTMEFARTAWESHDVEIVLAPGPTYRLAIAPESVPLHELAARLIFEGEANPSRVEFDPIHTGTPPWVRFPGSSVGANGNHRLEVRSRDGLLFGSAPVSRGWGVEPNVVRIDLERRAAIEGRVVDSDGRPLADVNLKLRLVATAASAPPREAWTALDGAFRFDLLPVESTTLSASLFRYEPVDGQRVELVPGQPTVQVITMRRLPSSGTIRARLTSETGRFDAPTHVALSSLRTGSRGVVLETVEIQWVEDGGRKMAICEFKDVPADKYRVMPHTDAAWGELTPDWDPGRIESSPPSVLDFVARDSVARADLVLRVHDAVTLAPITDFDSFFDLGPLARFGFDTSALQPAVRGVPVARAFQWRIDKTGYRAVLGSEKEFNVEETHDGRTQRIAEIALQPGWAEVVRVTDSKSKKSMPGVRVLVDGNLAGVTDESGLLRLEGATHPRSVSVELDGWLSQRIHFAGTGRSRHALWLEVEMLPEGRR